MKNLFYVSLVLTISLLMINGSATAQTVGNGQAAIGKTKSQCGNNYIGQGVSWEARNTILGICAGSGSFEVWEVWVVFSCPPQHLTTCLPAPPVQVSKVIYSCNGTVEVECL